MSLAKDIILDDRYSVIRSLGGGGMGTAYLVEDQRLSRSCVAKEASLQDPAYHEQFEQEAQILAGLRHPNLPEIYDYFLENDQPYLIMQFIEGTTLDRLQDGRSAPFEVDQVLRWAKDLLDALVYLHSQNPPVIHRDVKPSNVCITPEGGAVLLDFGIARRLDRTSTRTGAQAHSLYYSPIEQYKPESFASYRTLNRYLTTLRDDGFHTSTYSDIYSLGATLYFALTLLEPPDACMRFLEETPRPIHELNPEVPDFLVDAINQAIVIDPRERCQRASDFQDLLRPQQTEISPPRIRSREPRPLPTENVEVLGQELIYIPAGDFTMGSDDPRLKNACRPQHTVDLGAYCIGRLPVTNVDYQRFIEHNPEHPVPYSPMRYAQRYNWDRQARTFPRGLDAHPVILVTWKEARAYCHWLSDVTGYQCRLPTEAEWEKAARWDIAAGQARLYPWGNAFDENRCNVDAHGALRLKSSPVGKFSPLGDSPSGLADMAGNVWEWTSSLYQSYPYCFDDGREEPDNDGKRVVRGGAYDQGPLLARSAWRDGVQADRQAPNIGFRVACDAMNQ
jgi:formylglycine-generating enzyme required for sulfatase activity/tRNA A-37 threonylcarbamoyl transferase component Bud32